MCKVKGGVSDIQVSCSRKVVRGNGGYINFVGRYRSFRQQKTPVFASCYGAVDEAIRESGTILDGNLCGVNLGICQNRRITLIE